MPNLQMALCLFPQLGWWMKICSQNGHIKNSWDFSEAFAITLWVIEAREKSSVLHILAAGRLGHGDPRLQPDDLATRGQPHGHGGSNEAFLPQLRVPAPAAAFLPVASSPASAHRAVLYSGPWGTPRLLQYPHDAAEWAGTGPQRTAFPFPTMISCQFFFFSLFVSRIQHLHYVILKYVLTNDKILHNIMKPIYLKKKKKKKLLCWRLFESILSKTALFSPGVQRSSLGNKRSVWIEENVASEKVFFFTQLSYSWLGYTASII